MGKFDGVLLCTDLDSTLLNDEHIISEENINAIEYFKKEGGLFTFVTGRVPGGAVMMTKYVKPNIPIVTFNGAGIYDAQKKQLLWGTYLDEDVKKIIEYVNANVEGLGLVVCTDNRVYFPLMNKWVGEYITIENSPRDTTDYKLINEKWKKILFVMAEEDIPKIRELATGMDISNKFDFVQSTVNYFEVLPKNVSKGTGLKMLAELVGVDRSKIIAVGDNENDVSMIEYAGTGIAVKNAIDRLKNVADLVTVSNNEHAIAKIIYDNVI